MTRQPKNNGDFLPKYKTVDEIEREFRLLPAQKVCELVKHYSMCLFGLATDIGDYTGQLAERDSTIERLRTEYKRLAVKNANLRLQLKSQGKDVKEIENEELARLRSELHKQRTLAGHYKKKCEELTEQLKAVKNGE